MRALQPAEAGSCWLAGRARNAITDSRVARRIANDGYLVVTATLAAGEAPARNLPASTAEVCVIGKRYIERLRVTRVMPA